MAFNFQMPTEDKFRYTEEHPYISNGKGRNSEKGKAYTGVDADVAEFEDMFLCYPYTAEKGNKMGLGVDEYCDATINFARKNYADLLDIQSDKIKLVGNTIKSKKMPIYIEKIYNMQIPLKDIATVGKIKTSIDTYINSCKQLTAGGTKKARQAWYELAIKHNLNVHMGDAIYYINTGNKKSSSDVQRITKFYYINDNGQKVNYVTNEDGTPMLDRKGNNIDLTKQIERDYNKAKKNAPDSDFIVNGKTRKYKISLFDFGKKKYPNLQEEDVLIFNCVMLSNDIVEDEEDHFCNEDFEYNKDKYIDMFNKRIKPLLVCFDKSIRTTIDAKGKEKSNILITDPSDRRVFTEEESKLVSGQPYNATDQDTYQQLMAIEDKEIKFWLSVNKKPPYVDECDINWEETVNDYNERMKRYQEEGIKAEIEEYEKIVNNFSQDDVENLIEEGILPDKLLKFAELDVKTNSFVSKKFNIKIGSLSDVFDILGENEWNEVAE